MCSNTTNVSGGCGCNDKGGGLWSSSGMMKKQQKRPRVPKRGPGVAELEKILREQEKKDKTEILSVETYSSSCSSTPCLVPFHSTNNNPSNLKLSLSLRMTPSSVCPNSPQNHHLPLVPKFDHLNSLYCDNGHSISSGLGRGGHGSAANASASGSGFVLPEQAFFSVAPPCSCKSNPDRVDCNPFLEPVHPSSRKRPSPSLMYKNDHCPPPPNLMKNQFSGSVISSSSSPSSVRIHRHIEPPSNQSPYYTHMSPEEDKMVGMKIHVPFSPGNYSIPSSHFHAHPAFFPHMNRQEQSPASDHNHSQFNVVSSNPIPRDAKWGSTLEVNSGVDDHGNLQAFSTHTASSPSILSFQGELSKYKGHHYQDGMENSLRGTEWDGSDDRPFYRFLPLMDQKEKMMCSKSGVCEGGDDDGIDLDLKL